MQEWLELAKAKIESVPKMRDHISLSKQIFYCFKCPFGIFDQPEAPHIESPVQQT